MKRAVARPALSDGADLPQAMEIHKHPRRPMNHSASKTNGHAETDLLFADELEMQCVAQRSTVATPRAPRGPAVKQVEQIELIPILPIDEENAARFLDEFPVEANLLSTAPLRVVPAKQLATTLVLQELRRPRSPLIARPKRRFRLARVGALAVIAGFGIGWVAGRPPSQSVSPIRTDAVSPTPVGESPLGTSGLEAAVEKPAPPSAPRADDSVPDARTAPASATSSTSRKEADVVRPPATIAPPVPRSDAPPAAARVDTAATAPAPVPLTEMPVASAPREPAVEKPVPPPPAVPAAEAPVVTSTPSRPPVSDKSASPAEPLNEAVAVRAALAKYASGYTDLDAAAVKAVWPSVDQAGLRRAFSALDAQQVTFDRCDVQITGSAGRATCAGTTMWRPKIGGGSAREQNRTWNFVLKNAGGSWQIVNAEVR
jgi:hypothetical protein